MEKERGERKKMLPSVGLLRFWDGRKGERVCIMRKKGRQGVYCVGWKKGRKGSKRKRTIRR